MTTNFSATAPFVGRHRKSNSLVGFDPLLKKDDLNAFVAANNGENPVATRTPPNETDDRDGRSQQDVSTELRMIASRLELSSPKSPKRSTPTDEEKVATRRKALPWQKRGHRKTKSLAAVPNLWNRATSITSPKQAATKQTVSANSSPIAVTRNSAPTIPTSPNERVLAGAGPSSDMIHDLMELQFHADAFQQLALPGLSKPRPTSFLTGAEMVRTSEVDATAWQLEIPARCEFEVAAKVAQFLESYEKEECLLDLTTLGSISSMDLRRFAAGDFSPSTTALSECHRATVESLLECSDNLTVQGFLTTPTESGDRRQVLVLERQRQFLCVFTGTTAEQQGKFPKPSELTEALGVSVYGDRLEAVQGFEASLFGLLDKLTEENPFYDVVFGGHCYGGAMATLAAFRYARIHADLRIAALVTACPKVGGPNFRLAAHSLPNLKVMRVEYGSSRAANSLSVGHTIRIHPSVTTNKVVNHPVKAYKFSDANDVGRSLFKRGDKDVADYVQAYDSLHTWVQDYHRQDGAGVKGKDNEARQMV